MMASPHEVTGPINIGNPREFSIKQLAETVLKMVGGKSRLVLKPLPQDDPKQRQPDITVARNTLNWEPEVELEVGLEKTISYFKQCLVR
jgi:UDP-glucuronate decarboxylase